MKAIDILLTVDETAKILKVDKRVVYNLIDSGDLRAKKVGRSWRISRAALYDYLDDERGFKKGTCIRCGGKPMADYRCRDCGSCVVGDSDSAEYDSETECLYEESMTHGGDFARKKIVCSCGCDKFEEDKDKYCSYCDYQVAKDEDRESE